MPTTPRKPDVVSFDAFDVSVPTQEVFNHGTRIKLPPQSFRVLQMLLEHPGQLVTREEFHRALWSADTFVDFDQGLNNAIKKIRVVLNDSAEAPRYIETLPKLGYRFVGRLIDPPRALSVELRGEPTYAANGNRSYPGSPNGHPRESTLNLDEADPPPSSSSVGSEANATGSSRSQREPLNPGRRFAMLAIAVLIVGLIGALVAREKLQRQRISDLPLEWVPFTTLPGFENAPTFSPDGEQVAFDYFQNDQWNIYTRRLDDEKMIQITDPPEWSSCPSWSPDGKLIAYLKGPNIGGMRLRAGIYLMTPLGGAKRRLVDVANVSCHVGWSPDSKTLVYGPAWSDTALPGLFLLDIDDPTPRRLLTSPPNILDAAPAFSHDGKRIVFARNSSLGTSDLFVVSVSGGEPKRLTQIDANLGGPVWTADDQKIIFWAGSGWTTTLYSVSSNGGTPERLPLGTHNDGGPAISPDGHTLLYVQSLFDPNIWRIDLAVKDGRPSEFISSTWFEASPDFSPDGKKIAFLSDRDGKQAIWICTADGLSPQKLEIRGPTATGVPNRPNLPKWSPTGDQIAFDALNGDHRQIFTVDSEGGVAHQITSGEFESQAPSWSADGEWLYYGSERTGRYEIWKTSLRTRESRQITYDGGYVAEESPDGKFVYFDKPISGFATWTYSKRGLYATLANGGPEKLLVPGATWMWRVRSKGIYYTDNDAKPHPLLKLYHPDTGKTEVLAALDKESWGGPGGIGISQDGTKFLYAQIDNEGKDLMLVKNGVW